MLEKGGRQTFRNIRSVCVPTSPTKKMQSWKLTTRTSLSCDVFFCDMFSTSWTWFSIIERDLTISWLHLRCADELDACASEICRSGGLKASTIGMDTVEFFSWEGTSGFFPIRQKKCYLLLFEMSCCSRLGCILLHLEAIDMLDTRHSQPCDSGSHRTRWSVEAFPQSRT